MFYTSFYIFFFFLFLRLPPYFIFFFFNDTATTEIYTLSLHDALPIYPRGGTWAISVVRHVVPHDCWPGRKLELDAALLIRGDVVLIHNGPLGEVQMNSQAVIDDRFAGDSAPVRRIVPDPLPVAFADVRLNGLGDLNPCIPIPGARASRYAAAPPDS